MPTIRDAFIFHLTPKQTVPALIPAVAENVFSSDVYLEEITLTNESNSAVTVTVADKQTAPRAVLKDVSLGAKTAYVARFTARFCPNGITWVASDGTAVTGYVRGRT